MCDRRKGCRAASWRAARTDGDDRGLHAKLVRRGGFAEHTHSSGAGSHQVAHGLMRRIRNPHRRQLAAPVQLGQHRRVAPVGLNPIPGLHRDQ